MSLAERLESGATTSLQIGKNRCLLAKLFEDERLSETDRKKLIEVVDTPLTDPRRISAMTISLALRAEGLEISSTSVNSHRKKACPCYSVKDAK